jgi:hypothetical protein
VPDLDAGRPRTRRHRKACNAGVDLKDSLDGDRPSLRTAEACVQASARVSETAARQRWSADEKHVWLERLARRLGVDWEEFLRRQFFSLMHPNEIGALDPAIADVQLHTHRHRVPEERELFLREIADNRRALATCGLNPERLTHLLSERPVPAGLLAMVGVTCVPGLASKRQHPLLLPRGRHRTWSSRVGLLDCATSLPDPE